MKLYYHPASTTSRIVDLVAGEHLEPEFGRISPSHLVPVLEDGDFRLTESSAILKYLADKVGSPAYPKDLKARARVNEMMDWLNANLYKDLGYGLVYPQFLPHHKRPNSEAQAGTVEWGKQKSQAWLKVLDEELIGPNSAYLCGDKITLADYMGAEMITLGEVIRCSYAAYPNISRWLRNMKTLKSWPKVHEAITGFAASLADQTFVTL